MKTINRLNEIIEEIKDIYSENESLKNQVNVLKQSTYNGIKYKPIDDEYLKDNGFCSTIHKKNTFTKYFKYKNDSSFNYFQLELVSKKEPIYLLVGTSLKFKYQHELESLFNLETIEN